MLKPVHVSDDIFRTYLKVVTRMVFISNALCDIDSNLSASVEWSSRPDAIHVRLFRWNEKSEIEDVEYFDWYYGNSDSENTKKQLFAKIAEWEAKYGLE